MRRVAREEPLPSKLQGRWVVVDERTLELNVKGGEVFWAGRPLDYDYKVTAEEDGGVAVNLAVEDDEDEDSLECGDVIGLILTPEGELHAYNDKFACQLVRADD